MPSSRRKTYVAYVDGYGEVRVRDVRIRKHAETYAYRPCRGFSGSVVVEDYDRSLVGWMSVNDLPGGPYANVREWMAKTGYVSREE